MHMFMQVFLISFYLDGGL